MKKTIRLVVAAVVLLQTGVMSAQMTISPSGQISVGMSKTPITIGGVPTIPSSIGGISGFDPGAGLGGSNPTDSIASICIWDLRNGGKGGYISFAPQNGYIGHDRNCAIGQLNIASTAMTKFSVSSSYVMSLSPSAVTAYYNVKAPSFITISDIRLKKDTKSLTDLDGLLELSPVSYRLKESDTSVALKESAASPSVPDDRLRYGFIAQEVKEIFPNLVVEDEEGWLGIDYTGFIPLLVEAYKEMKQEVSDLRAQLADTALPVERRRNVNTGAESIPVSTVASLCQNKPNPFNSATVISYTLPESCIEAYIYIFDLQGKQLMKTECRDRGAGAVTIEAGKLSPGMYVYTLVADGEEVDTRRMIVSE